MRCATISVSVALLVAVFLVGPAQAEQTRAEIEQQVNAAHAQDRVHEVIRGLELLRYRNEISADERVLLAESYLRFDRLADAESEVNAVLAADPDRVDASVLLADVAARTGDWETARDLYQNATRKQPRNPEYQIRFGQALQELGDQIAADEAFARYVELTK